MKNLKQAAEAAANTMRDGKRAANLRKFRRCRGLTIKQLAAKANMAPSFLIEMTNHQRAISIRTVDRLAAAIGWPSWRVLQELDA